MKNNLMRLGFILIAISSISACTPNTTNQLVLQQHYICKSLIQGFFKNTEAESLPAQQYNAGLERDQ